MQEKSGANLRTNALRILARMVAADVIRKSQSAKEPTGIRLLVSKKHTDEGNQSVSSMKRENHESLS